MTPIYPAPASNTDPEESDVGAGCGADSFVEVGSPLWNRLLMPLEGRCSGCNEWTDRRDYDDDTWYCYACACDATAEQEREDRLNSPQHDQAESVNRGY